MIQTINKYGFEQAFKQAGRGEQFSYAALGALFDYFEEYEESTGEQIELDVVAICCEYEEAEAGDIFNRYDISCDSEEPTEEEMVEAVSEYLAHNTTVVAFIDGVFVYHQF
jgi:hypothetical protein